MEGIIYRIIHPSAESFIDYFNPIRYVEPGKYVSIWQLLFATLLQGFWARTIAVIALVLAFWFGVYRQRFILGVTLFLVSVVFTYFGGIVSLIFR